MRKFCTVTVLERTAHIVRLRISDYSSEARPGWTLPAIETALTAKGFARKCADRYIPDTGRATTPDDYPTGVPVRVYEPA